MLAEREALLRAIFDAPDDDLPRLVYADWLEEHGQPAHAGLIRLQCELARRPPGVKPTPQQYARQAQLIREVNQIDRPDVAAAFPNRGLRFCDSLGLTINDLNDVPALRHRAAVSRPEWFGASRFRLDEGLLHTAEQVATVMELAVFQKVEWLDLGGAMEMLPVRMEPGQTVVDAIQSSEFRYAPRITLRGLTALIEHPGMKRIKRLILRNNDLDNDALRVLIRAPDHLRLKELDVSHGNRFRGRVWQDVLRRFGESVVS